MFKVNIYQFQGRNKSTKKRSEICLKLAIKTPERHLWHRSGVLIVNNENISHSFRVTIFDFE